MVSRKFQKAIDDGVVKVDEMMKMSSPEREELFKKILGKEYAVEANRKFVSKFNTNLTKEQLAMVLSRSAGVNKQRLAYETFGVGGTNPIRTMEDYHKLAEPPEWALKYDDLTQDISDIINPRNTMGFWKSAGHYAQEQGSKIAAAKGPLHTIGRTGSVLYDVATDAALKPLKAAWDVSYIFRQGFKIGATDFNAYKIANKDAWKSVVKSLSSKEEADKVMRAFRARTLVHPYYKELVVEGKLAVNVAEETFPRSTGEKVTGLGRVYLGTNNAFTTFSQSARLEIAGSEYEKLLITARKSAISTAEIDLKRTLSSAEKTALEASTKVDKQVTKDIAFVVNSITGRGSLGKAEAMSSALNRWFFAPRYIRSSIDTFVMPFNYNLSGPAKELAFKSSRNTLGSIGVLLGAAAAFGTDVELDPFSNNFGTVKLPGMDKRVDLTAGHGQYVRVFAQLVWGKRTDSKGRTIEFGDSKTFKPDTRVGNTAKFFMNKAAPAPSMINQLFSEKQFYGGQKVSFATQQKSIDTIVRTTRELFAPIGPNNLPEYLQDEGFVNALMLFTVESLGANVKESKY